MDTGFCIASISGQSMGASAPWDGRIDIEEYIQRFTITGVKAGRVHVKSLTDSQENALIGIMYRSYTDSMSGRTALGAFAKPFVVGT